MKDYQLEKYLWTEEDFDQMGWHDSNVYAIAFGENFELKLDIDYIFQWVHPKENERHFSFWISPCTLIFENVWDLKFNLQTSTEIELEIDDIRRENPQQTKNAAYLIKTTEYDWIIETHQGMISFKAVGYRQYVRRKPIFIDSQMIGLSERGGVSFETEIE